MFHLTGGPEEAAEQLIRHLEQQGKLPNDFPNSAQARFDEMRKCQGGHHWVYVLRLRGDKIAVGSTGNLTQRIADHFSGQGSAWTKKHPSEEVTRVIRTSAQDAWGLEEAMTVALMIQHGHNTVRGGGWNSPNDMKKPKWFREAPGAPTADAAVSTDE